MPTVRPLRILPWLLLPVAIAAATGCGNDPDEPVGACGAGLLPGDLVFTEIMADPPGADSGREWFELYNASPNELELQGVLLLHSREDGTSAKIHPVARSWTLAPGEYGVAGALIDEADVLAVVPYVDYGYAGELGDMRNSAGRLVVACGSEIIDEVLYTEPSAGTSRGFTGDRTPDALGNDDLGLWCDAHTALDAQALGTPGARNDFCVGTGPVSCIEDGTIREARGPALGDLVITEIMSDPVAVVDDDGEWFEVRANADFDLNGIKVGRVADLSDAKVVVGETCVPVRAGTLLVFGRNEDPAINGGLPRVDGLFNFDLNQSNNRVVVSYRGELLDELAYGTTKAGTAHNLDPRYQTPELNDDPAYTCRATTPYGAGDLGTPGEANIECDIPAPEGQCLEADGSFRDLVAPQPGDLTITELMANPEAAAQEADSEWFEVRAAATFDLNGLALGTVEGEVRGTIDNSECLRVTPGDSLVIARDEDAALNGGLPRVDAVFGFSLINSNGALWIGTDSVTLDLVTWAAVPAGAARSLDPLATDPQANDDEAAWCPAIDAYGDGDLGTPGADNPSCGTVSAGTCNDGGSRRDVVVPQLGDLVITEWMADPSATADAEGEWFELLATASVDLNGLQLANDAGLADGTLPVGGDCLSVAAGERVIVARNADPLMNGGLPPVIGTFGFGLTNSGGAVFIGAGGEVLDSVTWATSTAGTAWTVDPSAEDPVGNDDPSNVCLATDVFGAGDRGTPGAQGPACGGGGMMAGMCMDGGVPRPIVSPAAGELVITEWMPDPAAVTDANGEWFELLATASIDLNGLQLANDAGLGDSMLPAGGSCLSVASGQRVIVARQADALVNGGLPPVIGTFSFGLTNAGGAVFVGLGGVVLDTVSWAASTPGAAWSVDPGSEDPLSNDDPGNACLATMPFGAGDNGTPAAPNPAC